MTIPLRPLTRVERVIKAIGLEITYAYDDLVFAEHNAFVLQFGNSGKKISLYFNEDLEKEKQPEIERMLIEAGKNEELEVSFKGTYSLEQVEEEKIKLVFNPISAIS